MDYPLPPTDIPDFELDHIEFEYNRLVSSRGVGEGGTILAPAALLNAIEDAILAAGGSPVTDSPLTPTRIPRTAGRHRTRGAGRVARTGAGRQGRAARVQYQRDGVLARPRRGS